MSAQRPGLVAYVSGHGFGHATRVGEVLRAVRDREPEVPIGVVTSGPEELYRRAVPGGVTYRRVECDVGLVQRDALSIDEEGTVERCRGFAEGFEALVAAEADWLRGSGARVVLGDVPPLAFAAAHAAGLPSLGLANFSWDWVYRHFAARHPDLHAAADEAAQAYAKCGLLLELPFAGDLSAFPVREPIPLVARRARRSRRDARQALGEREGVPLVLLSFGGLGFPDLDVAALCRLQGYRFLSVGEWQLVPDNARRLRPEDLEAAGLGYPDLVAAADAVVTKPGYGIVSDAIAAGTRIVYTERGDFPEYPILVAGMSELLPCAHVSNADLTAGRIAAALEEVLARPVPPPPALNGAVRASERLLAHLLA